jgi:acetyl-CoA acetyltransferase family protein
LSDFQSFCITTRLFFFRDCSILISQKLVNLPEGMNRNEAYIVDAIRTPVGKYGGILKDIRPDDLSAVVITALLSRANIRPDMIQDVLWGCANQAGEDNRNIGRMASLLAGLPYSVPGSTINRLCGSSLDAINMAARSLWSGDQEVIIAGGVESMSRAPYSVAKNQSGSFGNVTAYDTALGWRYPNSAMEKMFPLESMGETAENVAEKAVAAQQKNIFHGEITGVEVLDKQKNKNLVLHDEGPRPETSVVKLSKLTPVFRKNGTVTAGNSSSLNDGAAGVLLCNEAQVKSSSVTPLGRIVSTGIAGVDPRYMGIGPVPAVTQALKKAGINIKDIGLIELNEAFAAQSIAVMRDLSLDPAITNVNGGAIALGHPLGCSGARIMTTLLHEMKRRNVKYGIATMCIGVGQGIATVVEGL